MKLIEFESLFNDLFVDFKCDCGNTYHLAGYNDDYFFLKSTSNHKL